MRLPTPRPVHVALMLLVVVAVGAWVLGLGRGLQPRTAGLDEVRRWFGEARPIAPGDLTMRDVAACARPAPDRFTVEAGHTCALLAVKAAPWRRRALALSASALVHAVVVPAGGASPRVEGDVDPGGASFPIPSAGATVSLTCAGAAPCTVALAGR